MHPHSLFSRPSHSDDWRPTPAESVLAGIAILYVLAAWVGLI